MFLQALWLKNSQIVKLFKGINYISVLEAADRKAVRLTVVAPVDRGVVRAQVPGPRVRIRVLTGCPEVAVRAAVVESAIRVPVAGQKKWLFNSSRLLKNRRREAAFNENTWPILARKPLD